MVSAEDESVDVAGNMPRQAVYGTLLLTFLFLLNFLSRILFSPLLPILKEEFVLSNTAAGSIFLILSSGYFISILLSGFVSAAVNHANTIWISSFLAGLALIVLSFSNTFPLLCVSLLFLGFAAGFYLPSGLSTIYATIPSAYLARGMAIHELAPNLGFVLAPLLWELVKEQISWRLGLQILGALLICIGTVYSTSHFSSKRKGIRPDIELLVLLFTSKHFWLLVFLFAFAICSTLGVYSMLPLFLVATHGMTLADANVLTSTSRIISVFAPFLGGWLGDRFGNKLVMTVVLVAGGIITASLGLGSGSVLIVLVFLQPVIAVCFFPSGLAVLSSLDFLGRPNAAISFCIPIAFVFGGGLVPVVIGTIGDIYSLSFAMTIIGAAIVAAGCLAWFALED